MLELNYKYLKSLGLIDYTYENKKGGSGLVTYTDLSVKLRNEIKNFWIQEFITNKDNILIDGPVFTPKEVLVKSGHLQNMSYELFNINEDIYLRPQTCQTIFQYYLSAFGKQVKNIGIGQIGLSFRNEKTTRTNLLRLKEFTQLEVEVFSTNETLTTICINEITYEISAVLNEYVDATLNFFKQLDLPVDLLWKTDKPHYAKATIDFMYNDVELASLNDRGNHDLPEIKSNIFEVSVGLDRTYFAVLYNFLKNKTLPPLLAPELGIVYSHATQSVKKLMPFVKPYAIAKYSKLWSTAATKLLKLGCEKILIFEGSKVQIVSLNFGAIPKPPTPFSFLQIIKDVNVDTLLQHLSHFHSALSEL